MTMDIGYITTDQGDIAVFRTRSENTAARIALEMVLKNGLIVADDGGEDSAGRQKVVIPAPVEIAKRACDIAEALVTEFVARGWFLDLPTPVAISR